MTAVALHVSHLLLSACSDAARHAVSLLVALAPIHAIALRVADVVQGVLDWRATLQQSRLLLVLLPALAWLALQQWLSPGLLRRALSAVWNLLTGRGHASRCALRMVLRRQVPKQQLEEGDTCPICLDELRGEGVEGEGGRGGEGRVEGQGGEGGGDCGGKQVRSDAGARRPLTFCRWGCGRAVHASCMEEWRSHRNAAGTTHCLFCGAWM